MTDATPRAVLRRDFDPRFGKPRVLFFGIGAQKSATSWLDDYLRGHSEVCLPVRKEQHYWNTMLAEPIGARRRRVAKELERICALGFVRRLLRKREQRAIDRAWALADTMFRAPSPSHGPYADVMFQAYRGEGVVGEITPEYALLPTETFAEMASLGADVRFLFIMRDPVGRFVSGARHSLKRHHGAEAVSPSGLAERVEAATADPADMDILRSRYDLTIQRLESVVPPERICYFFYETLFRQSEMDRLTAFLGIGTAPAKFDTGVNVSPSRGLTLTDDLERRVRASLEPAYAFVEARFGALVPDGWRH